MKYEVAAESHMVVSQIGGTVAMNEFTSARLKKMVAEMDRQDAQRAAFKQAICDIASQHYGLEVGLSLGDDDAD
jgi:hypothetical protein